MKEQYRTIQLDTERWLEPLREGGRGRAFYFSAKKKLILGDLFHGLKMIIR